MIGFHRPNFSDGAHLKHVIVDSAANCTKNHAGDENLADSTLLLVDVGCNFGRFEGNSFLGDSGGRGTDLGDFEVSFDAIVVEGDNALQ